MGNSKPLFITFEGGEGSGKSTQVKLLYEYLQNKQIASILTREVGGTAEAEQIRDVLVHNDLEPTSQLLLVMAARYEHLAHVVLPALAAGKHVICDRFIDSTIAYQSDEKKLTIDHIFDLHDKLMPEGILPNITIFFDLPPERALARAHSRGETNKFDHKSMEFHKKIYKNFKYLADKHDNRFIVIECGDKPPEAIHHEVISLLERRL